MSTTEPRTGRDIYPDGMFVFWRDEGDPAKRQELIGHVYACTNPECTCQEVQVGVSVFDESRLHSSDGDTPTPSCTGLFNIDLITGRVNVLENQGKAAAARAMTQTQHASLRQWLAREADPEFLDALNTLLLGAKGLALRKKPRLPPDRDPTLLVPWSECIPGTRDDGYLVDDEVYVVIDQYCLNPRCSCREVVLSFVQLDGETSGDEIGAARVLLPELQITTWEPFTRSKDTLTRVFEAHKQRYGERALLVRLEQRRRQMHALGKKHLGGRGSRAQQRKPRRRRRRKHRR